MKIFSNREPVNRKRAASAAMVNQLATPGLGSLMCRRWLEGTAQLILALIGFFLMIAWMFQMFAAFYQSAFSTGSGNVAANKTLGWLGGGFFMAAWFWSGWTSLTLLREAEANERNKLVAAPPRIT